MFVIFLNAIWTPGSWWRYRGAQTVGPRVCFRGWSSLPSYLSGFFHKPWHILIPIKQPVFHGKFFFSWEPHLFTILGFSRSCFKSPMSTKRSLTCLQCLKTKPVDGEWSESTLYIHVMVRIFLKKILQKLRLMETWVADCVSWKPYQLICWISKMFYRCSLPFKYCKLTCHWLDLFDLFVPFCTIIVLMYSLPLISNSNRTS